METSTASIDTATTIEYEEDIPKLQPISVVESRRIIRKQVTKFVDGENVVVDEEGKIAIYNPHWEPNCWEIYDDLNAVFDSAIWHRQFQRSI
jgi:hypothetical protein